MQLLSQTNSLFLQRRIQIILATSLVLVALAASIATGYNLWRDRIDSQADQRRSMVEDSATLMAYSESIIERSEHTLRGVEAGLRTAPEGSPSDRAIGAELARALRYESANRYLAFQRGDRIVVIGEEGIIPNALAIDSLGPQQIAPSDGVLLGEPVKLSASGDYLYPVALDTTDRSGQALRLAALIPRSQLSTVLEQLASSNPGGLGLTLMDGTIWIRYPYFEKFVGAKIPSSASVVSARHGGGIVNGTLAPDRESASFAVTPSRRYPIFAIVAQPDSTLNSLLWGRATSQLANLSLLLAILIAASLVTRNVVKGLAASESFYRTLFEGVSDSVIVCDSSGIVVGANDQAAATLLGRAQRTELMGQSIFSLIYVETADGSVGFEEVRRQFGDTLIGQRRSFPIRIAKGAGEAIDCLMTVSAVAWGARRVLVCVIKDVAAEQRYLRQMEAMAQTDPLTGLPNRAAVERAVDARIQSAPREGFAVLLCDVLRLREVNEAYGHQVGDELLCRVGERLQDAVGERATVGRHGGGAFVAIVPSVATTSEAAEICKRLRDAVAAPLSLAESAVEVTLSIGVALYPHSGVTAAHLLRRSDLTLVRAKEQRLGYLLYDGELDVHQNGPDLTLRTELAHAIRDSELQLAFQPKIRLEDSELVGAEMLLRWKHPTRGWVSPAEFIPLAESTELIYPLTRWVLEATVAQLRRWQLEGRSLAVSVNVSAINLQDPEFVPSLEALIERTHLDPRDLELEITEGALMQDHDAVAQRLFALHDLGVNLSLDDFGTGFSSLDYVRRFPFNSIKVDKSFVFGMLSREKDRQVVELTLMLAKKLGLKSIAEGVETEEVALALLGMGCDTAQGYLFSAPLLTDDFEKWRRQFAEKSDHIQRLVPGRPTARAPVRNPRMRPN